MTKLIHGKAPDAIYARVRGKGKYVDISLQQPNVYDHETKRVIDLSIQNAKDLLELLPKLIAEAEEKEKLKEYDED